MIAYSLIPDEFYEGLPEDPEQQFLLLAQEARTNFVKNTTERVAPPFSLAEWQLQYLNEIEAIGRTLGIAGIMTAQTALDNQRGVTMFNAALATKITELKLKHR